MVTESQICKGHCGRNGELYFTSLVYICCCLLQIHVSLTYHSDSLTHYLPFVLVKNLSNV